ncbi:FAD-binding protein [Pseudooceanicola sp. CBS1P-1]|uniref:FAD-binding protein n=1 Tax=Pseudooceanicola albus TaxID=2692189 RepID=A0A6L7FZM5_9RHOB|nr:MULTISPECIES: FAD-binding protein [Pseudooceanicola]MBT9384031.1 FAD-binding protein [Pseudooceanicola endophyticus]MXN16557.1 FAD-binding protein [Pseudooceanicola albus]
MRPESEAELAEMVAGAGGPLWLRGGGTQGPCGAGAVLETSGLAGVRLYEPGALTLVVGAGTPLAEVEALLAAQGQRLPFEPRDARVLSGAAGAATIGGIVAANLSGPRRVQAGACRDFVLGLRLVDGAGRILSAGGRVMKNVTGYDLAKLVTGSRGTLGVITEVSLKVLAAPRAEATLIVRGQGAEAAVADLCRAMGLPWEVSGAAWREGPDGPERLLRIEGLAGSVAYRAGRLAEALPGDPRLVEGAQSAALWRGIRDVDDLAGGQDPVWRLCLKPTDGPVVLAALRAAGLEGRALLDWSGGLVWLAVPGDSRADLVRAATARLGGHAELVRAPEGCTVPRLPPPSGAAGRLSAALRAQFDPRAILNPGLMPA